MIQQPESIEPTGRIESPGAPAGRSFPRRSLGPMAYVIALSLALGVIPSLFVDGGLTHIATDLGLGLGAGLIPIVVAAVLISLGFLVLAAVTPARDQLQAGPQERTTRIRLEDLPPLIGLGGGATRTRIE